MRVLRLPGHPDAAADAGRPGRLRAAMDDLREHILKEQNGMFPAGLATLSAQDCNLLDRLRAAPAS